MEQIIPVMKAAAQVNDQVTVTVTVTLQLPHLLFQEAQSGSNGELIWFETSVGLHLV